MHKTKKWRLSLVVVVIMSMLFAYGSLPVVRAASLYDISDTVTDSEPDAVAIHVITFKMGSDLEIGEYVRVVFTDFTTVDFNNASLTNTSASSTDVTLDMTATSVLASSTEQTLTVTGITNPGSLGSKSISVTTYTSANVEKESANVIVYILETVTVTATVNASLTFAVGNVDAGQVINGVTTTGTSSATTIPFGDIDSSASSTVAQSLAVSTNATDGFTVTVQQDGEMESSAGANINSFNDSPDGTGSTTPDVWEAPSGVLDSDHTYGHMGLTTSDADGALGALFTGSKYVGLDGTTATEVMNHTGPADSTTANKGLVQVAYTLEISDLQEAGDYTAQVKYICTPTY